MNPSSQFNFINRTRPKQPKATWTRAFPEQMRVAPKKVRRYIARKVPVKRGRSDRQKEYLKLKARFLARCGNTCPVMNYMLGLQRSVSDVHHTRGRAGTLLIDMRYWIPVSREAHNWIHENPDKASQHHFHVFGHVIPLLDKRHWNITDRTFNETTNETLLSREP
jgi:hypothetical protein